MFDVVCLFGKEELEVTPLFDDCGFVLPSITWQVEKTIVFDGKVCRAKDIFLIEWIFFSFGK